MIDMIAAKKDGMDHMNPAHPGKHHADQLSHLMPDDFENCRTGATAIAEVPLTRRKVHRQPAGRPHRASK
ncbi:MAG: hypothetical protein KGI94_15720 [Paracoccaceae bacterium]|nr:hypothetical protein [Paracoccaceae bacterium]